MAEGSVTNKIEVVSPNHMYFYNDIDDKSILELTTKLGALAIQLKKDAIEMNTEIKPIILHINSMGGYLLDGISGANTILSCDVEVHTIIDGYVASAGTLLSISGDKKYMHKHSGVLIHQLFGFSGGKFSEHRDNLLNMEREMDTMKTFYKTYTKIPMKKLETILERDLWMSADQCLE